jgi:hypothetical protein
MAKPIKNVTPPDRVVKWKKMWGTPRLLEEAETDAAYEEFVEAMVPGHMHKLFLKQFGVPKAVFGNRFFGEGSAYQDWDTRISTLAGPDVTHAEAVVVYGSPDRMEAHAMRGEVRRTLRDIIIDDWQAAFAVVRVGETTLYVFVEPKMRGCIVKVVQKESPSQN